MAQKTYANTKKSRSKIPKSAGVYNLKSKSGKTKYTGMTKNLNRRIKEHNSDPKKHFSKVSITQTKTKSQANKLENKRLSQKKPSGNKMKK